MARKRIVVSSAGGIAAGAPFVVGQGLVVQQVSPAVAMSARFGQVADAFLSFTAPGTSASATSIVLGVGSDDRGRLKTIIYGPGVFSPSAADATENIMFGSGLDPGAAKANFNGNTIVGGDMNLTGLEGGNILIGWDIINAVAGGFFSSNAVVIGNSSTNRGGSNVLIGGNSTCGSAGGGGQSVTIGQNTTNAREQAVIVGQGASGNGNRTVGIGQSCNVDGNCIGVGWDVDARGDSSIAVGYQATTGGFNSAMAFGRSAAAGAANVIMMGHNTYYLTELHIGGGYGGDGTSRTLTIRSTNGEFGVNNSPGWNISLDGPPNTGNSTVGGEVRLRSPTTLGAGAVMQTLSERLAVVTGTAAGGAPTVRIANQFSLATGVGAGTLTNAPTAGNPIDWWEVRFNGNVRYIPLWP